MDENKRCVCIKQWRGFNERDETSYYEGTDGNGNKVLFVGGWIIYKSEFDTNFKLLS
jgi:hypothetical protein